MKLLAIDRELSVKIRGIAILMIVLHNYFHFIFYKTKENEVDFSQSRFEYFLSEFIFSPGEWIQAFFSYFGHFGVQIFICLSAYVLFRAYSDFPSALKFVLSRIKKNIPIFIAVYIIWLLVLGSKAGVFGPIELLQESIVDFGLLLSGIYPFIPGNLYPMVGPWWYIAYMMEFYLLWAVMVKSRVFHDWSGNKYLVVIGLSLLVNYVLTPYLNSVYKVNLLLTPFGHLPEIFLGMYFAKNGVLLPRGLIAGSFCVLLLSGYYSWLWPLHHFSALLVFLYLTIVIANGVRGWVSSTLSWLGRYSLPIFLINGFLRGPFVSRAREYESFYTDILLGLFFLAFVCFAAYVLNRVLSVVGLVNK